MILLMGTLKRPIFSVSFCYICVVKGSVSMAAPLADELRPRRLEDMVGQEHLLSEGCALRGIIDSGEIPNMIFYGPSGIGKTTLANIIAESTSKKFFKLNATVCSTKDLKEVFESTSTFSGMKGILLYLDEIQYLNKKQQQTLLDFIEDGRVTLIASTTENPYFYVYNAILSRCTVFEFQTVKPQSVEKAVRRAFDRVGERLGETLELEPGVTEHIAAACGGDVRKAINSVELCVLSVPAKDSKRLITLERAKSLTQKSSMRYDRDGDEHYDILSAFHKSMRGSDPDAAVHYLARLLEAGDLPSACRRLLACACEDVGLAYPMIIPIVKAAVDTALQLGLPEGRLPLADAVILVATSPKSNSGVCAIDSAIADLKTGAALDIPMHLRDTHYSASKNLGRGGYLYAHNFPHAWVKQQYLPDSIKNVRYYEYGDNKNEQAAKNYWDVIKKEE